MTAKQIQQQLKAELGAIPAILSAAITFIGYLSNKPKESSNTKDTRRKRKLLKRLNRDKGRALRGRKRGLTIEQVDFLIAQIVRAK